jgi:tetratricopeptide (TPR) repeat protein
MLAAVQQAAESGFDTHAWDLAWTLSTFLSRRSQWHDLETTQQIALAAAVRLGDRQRQAQSHCDLGLTCVELSRLGEAQIQLGRALDLYDHLGDGIGRAHTLLHFGWLHERQRERHEALRCDLQALELYRAAGHRTGQARALNAVGWDYTQIGDYLAGIAHCQQALALQQEDGELSGQTNTWDSLGYAYHRLGDYASAASCYRRALDLARDLGHRFNEAEALVHIGDTHHDAGDVTAAQDVWRQAVSILSEIDPCWAGQIRTKLTAATPLAESSPATDKS